MAADTRPTAAVPTDKLSAYTDGVLFPSADNLAETTVAYYNMWKEYYIKQNPYTAETQYYVWYSGQSYKKGGGDIAVTVSEAHGYGMLATALMAEYDTEAQSVFDGLYRFYLAHPSGIGPFLMAWQQSDNGEALFDSQGADSATDGDLDIAYALLLADAAWGSAGKYDYYTAALNIINCIMEYEVNPDTYTLMLGDWASQSDKNSDAWTETRSSDFMLSHLAVFAEVTGDDRWQKVIDATNAVIIKTNAEYNTGLLPDFFVYDNGDFIPSYPNSLEGEADGMYGYNACRDPWRIGVDWLMTGSKTAKNMLDQLNKWIRNTTGGNVSEIRAGYALDGKANADYADDCFTVPFLVAAMAQDASDDGAQTWIDKLWNYSSKPTADNYFNDSISMFCLIAASGMWWSPVYIPAG